MMKPTRHQFAVLRGLERDIRHVAAPVGPQHVFWDFISDINAVTGHDDPKTVIWRGTIDELIAACRRALGR